MSVLVFYVAQNINTNLAASTNTHLLYHRSVSQKSSNSQLVLYLRSHKAAIRVLVRAGSLVEAHVLGSIQFLVAAVVMVAYFSKAFSVRKTESSSPSKTEDYVT